MTSWDPSVVLFIGNGNDGNCEHVVRSFYDKSDLAVPRKARQCSLYIYISNISIYLYIYISIYLSIYIYIYLWVPGSQWLSKITWSHVTWQIWGSPMTLETEKYPKLPQKTIELQQPMFRHFSREGGSESSGCDAGKTLHPQGQGFITVPRYSYGHGY